MKRYGHLFEAAFSMANLEQAYLDARKGKRKKRATFQFERNLGANLHDIHQRIHSGEYRPDPYFLFKVYEPKERIIHAPTFRDVVVQHAVYRTIYDIFDRSFIGSSFACRVGYGTHKASDYTMRMLRQCDPNACTLKLDIRKFFYSIDRDILRALLEKKIKDSRLINLMMMFAENDSAVGIPIGNLLSQIYALIYLNPLDHFIKRNLKVKRYARYVDDMVLFGLSRPACLDHLSTIKQWLQDKLRLGLSKSTIQKVKKGVNFVGYRTWRTGRFIRKYSLYKFFREAARNRLEACVSIAGHAKRTASLPYMMTRLAEISPLLFNRMPNQYRLAAMH